MAHMKVPSQKVKKLDDRSIPVIHLGKEPGTKAYRLYDPVNKRVHVSRDVIFEEKNSGPRKMMKFCRRINLKYLLCLE